MAKAVIIDTSSIVFGFENGKDAFGVAKQGIAGAMILISQGVLRELARIAQNKGKKGIAAKTALAAIKHKNLKVDNDNTYVDSWILLKAGEYPHSVVITNDTALYKKLESANITCLKLTKEGLLK